MENMTGLGYRFPVAKCDYDFLRNTLFEGRLITDEWRVKCDVDMFDEDSQDMSGCHWLVENIVARECLERLLLDRVNCRHAATIISMKYGRTVSDRTVRLFRDGWWDTETLSLVDFSDYFALFNDFKPPPPDGVPLAMRPQARAHEHGLIAGEEELTTEDIVRCIQVDSFMNYQKARKVESPHSQEEARKWAALALRTSKMQLEIRPKRQDEKKPGEELPGLRQAVYYPEVNTPSLADIKQPEESDDPI